MKLTKFEKAALRGGLCSLPRGSHYAHSEDKRITVLVVHEGPETVHVATAIAARSEEKISRKRGLFVALNHYISGRYVAMPRMEFNSDASSLKMTQAEIVLESMEFVTA